MRAIFNPVSPDEFQLPRSQALILIESSRDLKRTELLRLGYSFDKYLYFLFMRGQLINVYHVTPEKTISLPPEQGLEQVRTSQDAFARVVPLTYWGLFISKLLLTSNPRVKESFTNSAQFSKYVSLFTLKNEPALMQINWEHATGALFFPGVPEVPHSIFISHQAVFDEAGLGSLLFQKAGQSCLVTTFDSDPAADAWQEYYLRRVFAQMLNRLFSRFEDMTGRALVDSLVRFVAHYAARNDLDIGIVSRKLADHEVFPSPQIAAGHYRSILDEISGHFASVAGPRLLSLTLQDLMMEFSGQERQLIRTFELFSEEGILHG